MRASACASRVLSLPSKERPPGSLRAVLKMESPVGSLESAGFAAYVGGLNMPSLPLATGVSPETSSVNLPQCSTALPAQASPGVVRRKQLSGAQKRKRKRELLAKNRVEPASLFSFLSNTVTSDAIYEDWQDLNRAIRDESARYEARTQSISATAFAGAASAGCPCCQPHIFGDLSDAVSPRKGFLQPCGGSSAICIDAGPTATKKPKVEVCGGLDYSDSLRERPDSPGLCEASNGSTRSSCASGREDEGDDDTLSGPTWVRETQRSRSSSSDALSDMVMATFWDRVSSYVSDGCRSTADSSSGSSSMERSLSPDVKSREDVAWHGAPGMRGIGQEDESAVSGPSGSGDDVEGEAQHISSEAVRDCGTDSSSCCLSPVTMNGSPSVSASPLHRLGRDCCTVGDALDVGGTRFLGEGAEPALTATVGCAGLKETQRTPNATPTTTTSETPPLSSLSPAPEEVAEARLPDGPGDASSVIAAAAAACACVQRENPTAKHREVERQRRDSFFKEAPYDDMADPANWPPAMDEKMRWALVKRGPVQLVEYPYPRDATQRRFGRQHYWRTLSSGERLWRSWLVYSRRRDAVYCFCCKLFSQLSKSVVTTGFRRWKGIAEVLRSHEQSRDHRSCMLQWKCLCLRLHAEVAFGDLKQLCAPAAPGLGHSAILGNATAGGVEEDGSLADEE